MGVSELNMRSIMVLWRQSNDILCQEPQMVVEEHRKLVVE